MDLAAAGVALLAERAQEGFPYHRHYLQARTDSCCSCLQVRPVSLGSNFTGRRERALGLHDTSAVDPAQVHHCLSPDQLATDTAASATAQANGVLLLFHPRPNPGRHLTLPTTRGGGAQDLPTAPYAG